SDLSTRIRNVTLRDRGLPADSANPTPGVLLNDLNLLVTVVGEEPTMLVSSEEQHPGSTGIFFRKPGGYRVCSFVDLRNDDQLASGLKHSADLTHISGQVGPPDVSLHSGDQIEHVTRKWQARDIPVPNLHASCLDCVRVFSTTGGNAFLGVVNA